MPPRARTKPPHQQMPWASGKRRPAPKRQPWVKRVQKGFGKALRRHPVLGLVLQIGFAVAAVVLLVTGLLLENVLFFLATTLSALGGVATRRAVFLEQERQMRAGPKVTSATSGPRKPTVKPSADKAAPSASGVVLCTETKKPTRECTCASRHITTDAKAQQFGRPVGTPYGRRNKTGKSSNTDKAGG